MIKRIAVIILRQIFRELSPKIRTVFSEMITELETYIKTTPNKFDDLALKILKDLLN